MAPGAERAAVGRCLQRWGFDESRGREPGCGEAAMGMLGVRDRLLPLDTWKGREGTAFGVCAPPVAAPQAASVADHFGTHVAGKMGDESDMGSSKSPWAVPAEHL